MADIGKSFKNAWLRGMEAISNTASSIANNTKYKVDEMNIVNRRREILSDFGARAYELWQKGETFPEPLQALLTELSTLDEQLNAIRTEKLAGVKTEEPAEESATEEPANDEAAEDAAESAEAPEEAPLEDEPAVEAPVDEASSCEEAPVYQVEVPAETDAPADTCAPETDGTNE